MLLTNTIVCSILIFKMTQNEIKKTYPQTVLQHHRTGLHTQKRKNALKSLLHIHEVISRYFAHLCKVFICVNLSMQIICMGNFKIL